MRTLRVATMLLLVLAASALPAQAGTVDDPELVDPAEDQAIDGALDGNNLPGIPNVNDDDFGDIDILAAWFQQGRADCLDFQPLTCDSVVLVVQTTEQWTSGTLNATFRVARSPNSFANSTATGQSVSLLVQGTTTSGVPNATAAVSPVGLELSIPLARIGAVGGDVLANLTLTATRTSLGLITNPSFTQDDRTGSDDAAATQSYSLSRPARVVRWEVGVLSVGGQAGSRATFTERQDVQVTYRVTNLGTDPAAYTINVRSDDLPRFQGTATTGSLAPLQSAVHNATVTMDDAKPGDLAVSFYLGDEDPLATATITYAPVAAEREVKPAGLDFLTPAAESTGLDRAFGSYAELVLLSLIVLLVILAIFLLVAIAPSTLAGTGADEAPPLPTGASAAEQAPAGVLAAPAAAPDAAPAPVDFVPEPATTGGALAIESVTHEPDAPEEGSEVATEVVLRNPGPTRQVRVVLSRDGNDVDDKAITLPARATKTVRLAWTASAGENRVKVRVLPA